MQAHKLKLRIYTHTVYHTRTMSLYFFLPNEFSNYCLQQKLRIVSQRALGEMTSRQVWATNRHSIRVWKMRLNRHKKRVHQNRCQSLYYTIVCRTMPYYATLCHTMPHYATLCHTMPDYATLCHTMPHYATLCHTMPYYATLFRTMPCYASLLKPATGVAFLSLLLIVAYPLEMIRNGQWSGIVKDRQ